MSADEPATEHYSKAPITEAVLDLRVSLPEGVTVDDLVRLKEDCRNTFPTQEDVRLDTALLQFADQTSGEFTRQHIGFRLVSEDKRKVLLLTVHGFTFSHLPPYDTWEVFRNEARELWNHYMAACQPQKITRAALRYINRLDLPLTQKVNAYLSLYPTIPSYPNREALGFFMQLQIPQPDLEAMLIINEAKVNPPNPETTSLLLDFDLFREATWDAADDDAVWTFLDRLRARKNEIFEASITQKTRELIR